MSEEQKPPIPPGWADKLLEWLCPHDLLEEVQGDLHELFEEKIINVGEKRARREYILSVIGYMRPWAFKEKIDSTAKPFNIDMLRNYLKIAFRTLKKNRVHSFINLTGLAVACTFCLLVYTFIRHELSFDRLHNKASRIYRVEFKGFGTLADEGTKSFLSSLTNADNTRMVRLPPDLAADLQATFPEIQQTFRFIEKGKGIIGIQHEKFYQEHILMVDSNFFDIFSFRLLKGNPKTALTDPASVVVSEQTATRYFGDKDPIGQTIELIGENQTQLFKVTGVVAEAPANSSIYYKVLFPFHATGLSGPFARAAQSPKRNLSLLFSLNLIEVDEKANINQLHGKLKRFAQAYYKEQLIEMNRPVENFSIVLTPLADTHLDSISWGWPRMGKKLNLYVLSLISMLVLLIASLNYIFLTLTQSSARLQEVGIRKVTGASRSQLILQFWAETFILVLIASCAGFVFSIVLLPYFNELLDSYLDVNLLHTFPVLASAGILALIISLFTGIYPALLLSEFNPIRLLRQNSTYRINPRFSQVMVVIQYALCLFLVITTVVMKEQFRYITEKNLGFDKENMVVINLMENQSMANGAALLQKFKVMGAKERGILGVSGGDDMTEQSMIGFYTIKNQPAVISKLTGDFDYVQMMGLHIIEGRNISPQFPTDTSGKGAVVVNQQLAKLLGDSCEVGLPCKPLDDVTIAGIVKDFNYTSLSQPIGPALLHYQPGFIPNILIRTRPGHLQATLTKIEGAWKQFNYNKPLQYTFLDENIAAMYQSQQRWVSLIEIAAYLAIMVACLGLFGLSGLNALNRTKEIGIRKVLGASVSQIFLLLNKGTIRLAFLSFAIALPLAYYISFYWLKDFTYRINLGWQMFALAGVVGLIIIIVAVSYYSIKAALANPVKSLRNE